MAAAVSRETGKRPMAKETKNTARNNRKVVESFIVMAFSYHGISAPDRFLEMWLIFDLFSVMSTDHANGTGRKEIQLKVPLINMLNLKKVRLSPTPSPGKTFRDVQIQAFFTNPNERNRV
jgi:hypothetical protein